MSPAHAYLHIASIGDGAACAAVRATTGPLLKAMDGRDEIAGYRMVQVANEDDAEEEILSYVFDYAALTDGRFPFVYLMVQPPHAIDVDALMVGRGFRRVDVNA